MQRARVMHALEQEPKEAISEVKKDDYRRALGEAHDLMVLNHLEHKIRTDFQMTQDGRVQFSAEIELVWEEVGNDFRDAGQ